MVNEESWERLPKFTLLEYSTSATNPSKHQYRHIHLKFIVHLAALKKSATHDICPSFQTECNWFLPHRRLILCQKLYFIKKTILWSIWDHVTDKTECQRNFNCQYPTVTAWLFADGIWKNCEIIGILSPVWKHYFRLDMSWQIPIIIWIHS